MASQARRQASVLIVSALAFTVCFMVVWVSLIWMYITEVRRIEVIGPRAASLHRQA